MKNVEESLQPELAEESFHVMRHIISQENICDIDYEQQEKLDGSRCRKNAGISENIVQDTEKISEHDDPRQSTEGEVAVRLFAATHK